MTVIVLGKICRTIKKRTWRIEIQRDRKSCYTMPDKTTYGLLETGNKNPRCDMMAELWWVVCRQ